MKSPEGFQIIRNLRKWVTPEEVNHPHTAAGDTLVGPGAHTTPMLLQARPPF